MANLTRRWTWVPVVVCLLAATRGAQADSFLLAHASVVWTQENRVYIASRDSLTIQPTTQLTFRYKQDIVATGEVTAVYQAELIAAVLTSGSLAKVKHLDQVEITARPPEFRPPTLIRVGYPAAGRKNLLFDCTRLEPDTTVLQGAYRPESLANGSYRFVRDPSYAVARAWPDTLLVRLFEDAADEEIALERGSIDAAVFLPGEASTHIREAMALKGRPIGFRRGMYLTATPSHTATPNPAGLPDAVRDALERMNLSLFRGDLPRQGLPWAVRGEPWPIRFEVDPAIPGRAILERFLNAGLSSGTSQDSTFVVRVGLETTSDDEMRADPIDKVWLVPQFPVLCTPGTVTYVAKIGADPLVGLFHCAPANGKP